MRKKTKQLVLTGFLGVMVTGLVFTGYGAAHSRQLKNESKEVQQQLQEEIQSLKQASIRSKIQGWAPARELPAGHVITMEDIVPVELPEGSVPADWLHSREQIAGKILKLGLPPNTLLTGTLLYEEEPTPADLRYREMGFIQLPGALGEKDIVDIRIQFPTGQDYILMSKKKVESLLSGTVTMTMNEAEILSLSSAIVDAYIHKASIYALLYVEPSLQAKAIPTYPANDAVLQLIKKDPNIIKRAEHALNESARSGLEADLDGVSAQSAAEFAGRQSSVTAQPLQRQSSSAEGDQEQFVMGSPE
ncbi:SAF domain-containing protein [Fontibacillus sp. BL9]|uniref:SAF domain-containing protein n=1 Tax=Fontibacillus sp. BL9 TaxID=3389971 RepID=UPI0039796740